MVRRGAAAVSAVLVGLLASPGSAPGQGSPPTQFYGVVAQDQLGNADLERMGQGRVGTLRVTLSWAEIDSPTVPSGYDWSEFDELVTAASREGIDVLPAIYAVPRWVSLLERCSEPEPDCSITPPHTTPGLNAWRAFLATAVSRYGPDGVFWATHPDVPKRPLRTWQIWNEENDPGFFKPRPDVDRYADLLRAASEAIRDQDAGAQILLGGMCCHPLHGRDGGIRLTDYLRRLYDEPGIEDEFDAVAIHPYAKKIAAVKRQVERTADLVHREIGDTGASIWITEFGWSSSRIPHPLHRGPRGQAKRLRQAVGYFTRQRDRLEIRSVLWFSWRDVPEGDAYCNWCALSGLFPLASLDQPKPAWRSFVSFTGGS
jgi:hypothetical protein